MGLVKLQCIESNCDWVSKELEQNKAVEQLDIHLLNAHNFHPAAIAALSETDSLQSLAEDCSWNSH